MHARLHNNDDGTLNAFPLSVATTPHPITFPLMATQHPNVQVYDGRTSVTVNEASTDLAKSSVFAAYLSRATDPKNRPQLDGAGQEAGEAGAGATGGGAEASAGATAEPAADGAEDGGASAGGASASAADAGAAPTD